MAVAESRAARVPAAALALCLTLCTASLPARAEMLTANYNISLAGITIGRANIGAQIDGDRYRVDVSARMTGLVGAVTRGAGQATATGFVGQRSPSSTGYALNAQSSEGPRTIRVALSGGSVRASEMNPPLDDKPDRVPVTAAHKRGVMDPVSALIMPAAQPPGGAPDPASCNRTLPIFDGATRFDIVLSYKATETVHSRGYSGPVLVCAARYVPYAGHRPSRHGVQYMIDNRDMETWLVPVGAQRVLIPYRIAVATLLGSAVIEAADFSVHAGRVPATAASAGE